MDLKEKATMTEDYLEEKSSPNRVRSRQFKPILKDWFTDLSQSSSVPGLQYITMKRLTVVEKIFWVFTFVVSIALSYLFIREVWDKWRTSPVIVSFNEQLVPVGKVPFPSVTICPARKTIRSAYNFSNEFKNYLDNLEPIVKEGSENASVIREIERLENVGHICDQGTLFTILNRTRGDKTIIEDIVEVSPKIDDVFFDCTWRGKAISCKDLFTVILTYDGLCFNFNSQSSKEIFNDEKGMKYNYLGVSKPSKGWSYENGYDDDVADEYPRRGKEIGAFPDLEIILMDDANDRDGMCNSLERGFKVYLQHPADRPKSSLHYTPVLPKQQTSMALKFSMLNSAESLYNYSPEVRQCYFSSERKLQHYRTYTASNCKFECSTNHTFEKCGCVWYNMPFNDSEHYCTIESTPCYNTAREELATKEMRANVEGACHCLPSCNSIEYDADVVQTDFKLKTFLKSMKSLYNYTEETEDEKGIEYSRLELYFKAPRFVSMHRSELFGLTDFLANCGGLLGLFLGFSFLGLVEILYFLTLWAKIDITNIYGDVCLRKQRRKRQKLLAADLLQDYAKNSTLHGLRYITEPGVSVIEKVFWGITFTISTVMCFMFIKQIYRKWEETPVIVSLNEYIVPVGMVPFPSVTVCPQMKIITSRYNFSSELNKLFDINETNVQDENEKYKIEDVSLICLDGSNTDRETCNASSVKNIVEVSPKLKEVFEFCYWRGKHYRNCEELFVRVLTNEGVCYNFNSLAVNETFHYNSIQHDYSYLDSYIQRRNWNVNSAYSSADYDTYPRRGRANSAEPDLQVNFKSNTNERDDLCNGANKGYKIYVQHPADFPQASLYYYAALPNQVSSLALKFNMMTTSNSLEGSSADVRKCYFPNDRPLQYFQIYTLSNCQLECQSKFTFQKCGCIWFHMPHNDSQSICTMNKHECMINALDELAVQELKAEIDHDIAACRCFPACNSIHYDAEILKTDYDIRSVLKKWKEIYVRNGWLTEDDSTIYDKTAEYSKIEMYFKEPRFVSMRRSELYGRNKFLANCGGLLGLFLGFSFLSLVEIIYFSTLRLCCLLKRDLKAEKNNLDKRSD